MNHYQPALTLRQVVTAILLLSVAYSTSSAADITGIAIAKTLTGEEKSRACGSLSKGYQSGQIARYDVRNGDVSGPTIIYEAHDAHCPRISPSGTRVVFNTGEFEAGWQHDLEANPKLRCKQIMPDPNCKGEVCIIPVAGGEKRVLATDVNCLAWLDWPVEEYVYYQSDYEGSKLWRVNTTGTPKPQLLTSNFRGAGKSSPDGARYWSVSSDGKRVGGWFGGTLQAGVIDLDKPSVTMKQIDGGCGGSLSPDGTTLTRNNGSHTGLYLHSWPGGLGKSAAASAAQLKTLNVGMCSGGGSNWHRMHWPVNSSDWLLISMGNGYQIGEGCHPVLLKKDGRSCFQITPLKNGVYIEGSDFWFGDPDKALNQTVPVRHAPRRARRSRITVRQSRQGIWVGLPGNAGYRVALCRPNGRTVFAAKLDSRRTAFIPLQTKSGMYVLSARSATERMTRLIRVD
jgi:hypothetical protein